MEKRLRLVHKISFSNTKTYHPVLLHLWLRHWWNKGSKLFCILPLLLKLGSLGDSIQTRMKLLKQTLALRNFKYPFIRTESTNWNSFLHGDKYLRLPSFDRHKRFSEGGEKIEDDEHPGWPVTASTEGKFLKLCEILHDWLNITKVCAKMVQKTLTQEQNGNQKKISSGYKDYIIKFFLILLVVKFGSTIDNFI